MLSEFNRIVDNSRLATAKQLWFLKHLKQSAEFTQQDRNNGSPNRTRTAHPTGPATTAQSGSRDCRSVFAIPTRLRPTRLATLASD